MEIGGCPKCLSGSHIQVGRFRRVNGHMEANCSSETRRERSSSDPALLVANVEGACGDGAVLRSKSK